MSTTLAEGLVVPEMRRGERDHPAGAQVIRLATARLPTIFGEFAVTAYLDGDGKEHLLIRKGALDGEPPVVRLHSECLTGDALGSVRCDCREQLHATLSYFDRTGRGVLLYLRQEGRGIGLANKVRAYALQDQGMDTVEANLHLGFADDVRTYDIAAAVLRDQGISAVRLLTNNPRKIIGLEAHQIRIIERIPHQVPPRRENEKYLQTKAEKLGHILGL
jgi:3,4-dihydroxy 2-butanone 4-phosphate synthase/GTP cyclohydrolase II